ncbi:MAG: hypothetical protein HRU20_17740, partial [Pseudomonadales bacterium]|nr:hypothetical protein [Pseudomonadales bacterium]
MAVKQYATILQHLLFLIAFLSLPVMADTLILEQGFSQKKLHNVLFSFKEDKPQALAQLTQQPFQVLPQRFILQDINRGFDGDAYWYRFDVHNQSAAQEHFFLQVDRALLDDVRLTIEYIDDRGALTSPAISYQTGDKTPHNSRPLRTPDYVFPFNLHRHQSARVYLRVQSKSMHTFTFRLLSESAYLNRSADNNLLS